MFSKLSFNNITDSISNAAHRTQEQFSSAIEKIHLDDPETRLSILKRRHQLQETLGTVHDISQLPVQYKFLEQKSDALEKICKRLLMVTKTFEVEGYDYPPNLTESFNDWWSGNKDFFSFSKKKQEAASKKAKAEGAENGLLPRSFAQALSKATADSAVVLKQLKEEESKKVDETAATSQASGNVEESETPKKDVETDKAEDAEDAEDDEDDEDIEALIKVFESWTKCQLSMDQSKAEMDSLMVKEFNAKLTKLIEEDFKKGHELRAKVQDARLKFDTLRHEIKIKEQEKEAQQKAKEEAKELETTKEETKEKTKEPNSEEKEKPEKAAESKETEQTTEQKGSEKVQETEDADSKLFEELEDQFVSVTSETVEFLGELTDSTEIISLVKLFHNFQLLYYKQCVKSLEENLEVLNSLDSGEN